MASDTFHFHRHALTAPARIGGRKRPPLCVDSFDVQMHERERAATVNLKERKTKQRTADLMTLFEMRSLFAAALPDEEASEFGRGDGLEASLNELVADQAVLEGVLHSEHDAQQIDDMGTGDEAMSMLDALTAEQAMTGDIDELSDSEVEQELLAMMRPPDSPTEIERCNWPTPEDKFEPDAAPDDAAPDDAVPDSHSTASHSNVFQDKTSTMSSPRTVSSPLVVTPLPLALAEPMLNVDTLAERFAGELLSIGMPLVPSGIQGTAPPYSRNVIERREWTEAEDDTIRTSVARYGCRWRQIARQLPGRSDDAVRNRWNRLKDSSSIAVASTVKARNVKLPSAEAAGIGVEECNSVKAEANKPERLSWTRAEDATIIEAVQQLGNRWFQIAQRLPGRTDHAIRNRYHRLISMSQDMHGGHARLQRQQGATTAPYPQFGAHLPSGMEFDAARMVIAT